MTAPPAVLVSPQGATDSTQVGALVVGGDHSGLGIARSLGRRGIPVYVLDNQHSVSSFSKYVTRVIRVKDLRDERRTVDAVLAAGRTHNLQNWVLFATRDETVAAFSRNRAELSRFFRVTTPDWNCAKWAWDKNKTYQLATQLGIPCPQTFNPRDRNELAELYARLPLAVKPAVKENFFYATGAKAWRAETPEQLRSLYEKARRHIDPREIMIQEIIPGDGRRQYSYCAFFRDGHAHSTLVARRVRQHPREFGRAATYVESAELPAVEQLAERFLQAIDYYGLVEIEFKQDPRDGQYKLLDVNARTWGFHSLGSAAGVDFPYLQFTDQLGKPAVPARGIPEVGWFRMITDLPVAISELIRCDLTLPGYYRSLKRTRIESVFAKDDLLPSIGEVLLLPYLIAKKYY